MYSETFDETYRDIAHVYVKYSFTYSFTIHRCRDSLEILQEESNITTEYASLENKSYRWLEMNVTRTYVSIYVFAISIDYRLLLRNR